MVETGTSSVVKRIKQAKGGSYCVYVPYLWEGVDVLISFVGENYRVIGQPDNGRVTIKVSDYRQVYPAGDLGTRSKDGRFIGKKVIAIPVANFEELENELLEGREFLESQKMLKVAA